MAIAFGGICATLRPVLCRYSRPGNLQLSSEGIRAGSDENIDLRSLSGNHRRMCQTIVMNNYSRKENPRSQYRLERTERANKSVGLLQKFPKLKALRVEAAYFDSAGVKPNGEMKYKINLAYAKSMFWLNCIHGDCMAGDFDLTEELCRAIVGKRKTAEGELRCQGIRHNKENKKSALCGASCGTN